MRMLAEIVVDILPFLMIMGFVILGFALILYNQYNRNGFTHSLSRAYNAVYSNFDQEDYDTPMTWIFMVLFAALLAVIMLNMVVAIMMDTYERVQNNLLSADCLEKLELSINSLRKSRKYEELKLKLFLRLGMKKELAERKKEEGKYLFMLTSPTGDEDGSKTSADWEGKLRGVKKGLKDGLSVLKGKVDDEISAITNKTTALSAEIKNLDDKMDWLLRKIPAGGF